MIEIITAYLFQNNECTLPAIGNFRITYKPAETDSINEILSPASEEIFFRESNDEPSVELIRYIARRKSLSQSDAYKDLTDFCNAEAIGLQQPDYALEFPSFGSLQRNGAGNVYFKRSGSPEYMRPIMANKVEHLNPEHELLVGEKETNSSAMKKFLDLPEVVISDHWKMWALLLSVLAVLTLLYYFSIHPFSLGYFGNHSAL